MADEKKSKALALELRQIIQADRMAMDILHNAQATGQTIEERTQKETAALLKDADARRDAMVQQVQAEHEEELARRQTQAREQFTTQRRTLGEKMQENRDAWIQEMVSHITHY